MADKSFGVKELNLLNASGTPTVTSPNNLNLNANTVAISTSATVGNNLTVTSTTNSANLNVTGIGTLTRGFATDLSVSGISTISQPSNANPHSLWDVVNNGASAYRFTGPGQDGAEDNPNIYLVRGQRYIFKVNASGHPFQLRVANGGAAYSDGVTNNGAQSGNVVINVQHDAPAQLYYQCTNHGGMVGNIYIVGGPQVISGVVTATTFVGNLTGNPTGSGANLTNLPAANLTGTLPAISGANLTNLPAANLTGTLPAISGANLTSLPAQATIANNADNRVITGGSGVNLNGEANLTFNGNSLLVNNTSSNTAAHFKGAGGAGFIQITDSADSSTAFIGVDGGTLKFQTSGSSYSDKLTIDSSGLLTATGNADFNVAGGELDIYSTGSGDQHSLRLLNSDASAGNKIGIFFAPANNVAGAYISGVAESDFTSAANRDAGLEFGTRLNATFLTPLKISAAGYVTKPNQPAFSAYMANTYSWNNQTIVYDSELFDYGSNYSTSTGEFTAPISGLYVFGVKFRANGGFSQFGGMFERNGSTYKRAFGQGSYAGGDCITAMDIIPMTAGQTMRLRFEGSHGGATGGSQENGFWGYLLQ